MIFRFGWKSFQRNKVIKCMIILLLVATFLTVITAVSMVEVKLSKYCQVSDALKNRGRVIISDGLYDSETGYNIKDVEDLRSHLPECTAIWSISELFPQYYGEQQDCNVWCYSSEVVDSLSPNLAEGRWFHKEDMKSDVLKAVVSYNGNQLHVGDVVKLYDPDVNVKAEIEIIGVLENRESVFGSDLIAQPGEDFRMMFATYNYQAEGKVPLFFLAEEQILGNEDQGWFEQFNFRINNKEGFVRRISRCTVIQYPDDVSEETIDKDMEMLRKNSMIYEVYRLNDVRRNSQKYIVQDLYTTVPIVFCILIYIIIATLSISAISVKSSLHNYATYYICGMQWRQCSMISLSEAVIMGGISFGMTILSMMFLSAKHMLADTALHFGVFQAVACVVIFLLYVSLAWLLPRNIVKKTSAKEVLRSN